MRVNKRFGPTFALLLVVGCAVQISCGACRPQICDEDIHRDLAYKGPCVASVEQSGGEVYVAISRQCPWERLVNLAIFRGLQPGMTDQEARRVLGPPDEEGMHARGPFWSYRRQEGTVTISYEDQGSSLLVDRWWLLSAQVRAQPEEYIAQEVLARLPKKETGVDVIVLNGCGHPMVDLNLSNGLVREVAWLRNAGSWRPEAERAPFCRSCGDPSDR